MFTCFSLFLSYETSARKAVNYETDPVILWECTISEQKIINSYLHIQMQPFSNLTCGLELNSAKNEWSLYSFWLCLQKHSPTLQCEPSCHLRFFSFFSILGLLPSETWACKLKINSWYVFCISYMCMPNILWMFYCSWIRFIVFFNAWKRSFTSLRCSSTLPHGERITHKCRLHLHSEVFLTEHILRHSPGLKKIYVKGERAPGEYWAAYIIMATPLHHNLKLYRQTG